VTIFDNLSRPNVEKNVNWLIGAHGDLVQIEVADMRDRDKIERAVKGSSQVFHFAAQVAVTTSLIDPIKDFEVNARGTVIC
jgi:CDP-paratose 2-epimerase